MIRFAKDPLKRQMPKVVPKNRIATKDVGATGSLTHGNAHWQNLHIFGLSPVMQKHTNENICEATVLAALI